MPFTIPNFDNATYADQAEPDSEDFDNIANGVRGYGVLSGCAVSAGTNATNPAYSVSAGTIGYDGYVAAASAVTNGTLAIGNIANPRFDLITVTTTGAVSVVTGTPSNNPVFPATSNPVVLAAIYVPANATSITANNIIDKRLFIDGVGIKKIAIRTTDATVTASTVLVSAGLDIPIPANSVFIVEYILAVDSNTTGDQRYSVNVPSGASVVLSDGGLSTTVIAQNTSINHVGPQGSPLAVNFFATVVNPTNAGTISLTFAQGAASGSTILKAGSRAEVLGAVVG